jgi:hypothetical protein
MSKKFLQTSSILTLIGLWFSFSVKAMDGDEDNQAINRVTARIAHYRTTLQEADNIIGHLLNRIQFNALNPRNPDKNPITYDPITKERKDGIDTAFQNYYLRRNRGVPSDGPRFITGDTINPQNPIARLPAIPIMGEVRPIGNAPLQNVAIRENPIPQNHPQPAGRDGQANQLDQDFPYIPQDPMDPSEGFYYGQDEEYSSDGENPHHND